MSQRNIIDKCMSFCLDVNLESWVGFVYGLGHGWCWQMRSEDVLLFRKDGTVKFNFRSCRRCHSQAAAAARLIYCTWSWRVSRRGDRSDSVGELNPPVRVPLRSFIFVCLILFLMRSFCTRLCSGLPHQIGRLYSHFTQRLMQAPQDGCCSSHFFRRRRQVKQPTETTHAPLKPRH